MRDRGWLPSESLARSLVTRKSAIIGVVIRDICHSFFAEITRGVEEVVEKAAYDILLCHSRSNVEKEKGSCRLSWEAASMV